MFYRVKYSSAELNFTRYKRVEANIELYFTQIQIIAHIISRSKSTYFQIMICASILDRFVIPLSHSSIQN